MRETTGRAMIYSFLLRFPLQGCGTGDERKMTGIKVSPRIFNEYRNPSHSPSCTGTAHTEKVHCWLFLSVLFKCYDTATNADTIPYLFRCKYTPFQPKSPPPPAQRRCFVHYDGQWSRQRKPVAAWTSSYVIAVSRPWETHTERWYRQNMMALDCARGSTSNRVMLSSHLYAHDSV